MRPRAALAAGLAVLGVVLTLIAGTLLFLGRGSGLPGVIGTDTTIEDVLFAILFASWSAVGAVLALRLPSNAVGWAFLSIGIVGPLIELPQAYGNLRYLADPTSPALVITTWLGNWIWIPPVVLIGLVVAIVPDGRLPSPRWRPLIWLGVAATLLQTTLALTPGPMPPLGLTNPFGVDAPWIKPAAIAGTVAMVAFMIGATAALFSRFRRARGVERQQLKWVAFGGLLVGVAIPTSSVAYGFDPLLTQVTGSIAALSVALFPVAIGVAVLRYRLYDIDLVVRRTVVYGSLSALIVATYIALVVVFQAVLRPLTGGSEIAVAASTLATLGLVQPLRGRIQAVVDRRFYRSRYDAAVALDGLTSRLRDEVDLDAVRQDLLAVIDDTLRPRHAGVWLRGAGR